eukprot:scaffold44493_cov81-Phaeocystis_antarctica.AAC.1
MLGSRCRQFYILCITGEDSFSQRVTLTRGGRLPSRSTEPREPELLACERPLSEQLGCCATHLRHATNATSHLRRGDAPPKRLINRSRNARPRPRGNGAERPRL